MPRYIKTYFGLAICAAVWLLILLKLALWGATLRPSDGVLSYTFHGWSQYPATFHGFLAQYNRDDFAQHRAYTSYTYPFVFFNFLLVAPVHLFLRLPYELACNIIPYFYVICLTVLVIFARRDRLSEVSQASYPVRWFFFFVTIGICSTDPIPWIAELKQLPIGIC